MELAMHPLSPNYSAMNFVDFKTRLWRLLGDDAIPMRAIFSRAMALALSIDECKALQLVPFHHGPDEIATTVQAATRSTVRSVRFVTPEEAALDVGNLPIRGSLWDMNTLSGYYLALQSAGNTRMAAIISLVEGHLGDRAAGGLHRNFGATPHDIRARLALSFGWTTGNAVTNQIALYLAGERTLAAAIDPLTMLMVSAPFMARHPLRPSELMVLVHS